MTTTTGSGEKLVRANGVDLCVEAFGDPADPAVLLVGTSMLTWEDEFCGRLADGSRHVIRYDVRDTGRSTSYPTGKPAYTLRDLATDAAGLLDELGLEQAHVVGFSSGGWIAQLLAVDHPDRVASLTLISTRAVSPGAVDPDLPDHAPEVMAGFGQMARPDWSDRESSIGYVVEGARLFAGTGTFDEAAVRDLAGRVVDRTANVASSQVNLASLATRDRWREQLAEVRVPTLVLHGTEDPFFPYGNGEALARDIPGARLVALDGIGHELPRPSWDTVVPAILQQTA